MSEEFGERRAGNWVRVRREGNWARDERGIGRETNGESCGRREGNWARDE